MARREGEGKARDRELLTCGFEQALEEALIVDSGHAADLRHLRLLYSTSIHKVGRDANGQFATHFSDRETWQCGGVGEWKWVISDFKRPKGSPR